MNAINSPLFEMVKREVSQVTTTCPDSGITRNYETRGHVVKVYVCPLLQVIDMICQEILACKRYILLNTSYWDSNSNAVKRIGETLLALDEQLQHQESTVKVRILIDTGSTWHFLGKKRLLIDRIGLPKFDDLPRLDIKIVSYHKTVLGTLHSKFFVVDGERAWIMSNNIQDRPNIEMAVLFGGRVIGEFETIFFKAFYDDKTRNQFDVTFLNTEMSCLEDVSVSMLFTNRQACGHPMFRSTANPQNRAWLSAIDLASQQVFIVSPTFNSKDAVRAVIRAITRNVSVTLLLTLGFNDSKESLPFQGGTNLTVAQKLWKRALHLNKTHLLRIVWYVRPDMNMPKKGVHHHVKYMSADGQIVIFGNGNMDTQSWYYSQEVNIAIGSADTVLEMDSLIWNMQNGGSETKFVYPEYNTMLPADDGFERFAY